MRTFRIGQDLVDAVMMPLRACERPGHSTRRSIDPRATCRAVGTLAARMTEPPSAASVQPSSLFGHTLMRAPQTSRAFRASRTALLAVVSMVTLAAACSAGEGTAPSDRFTGAFKL